MAAADDLLGTHKVKIRAEADMNYYEAGIKVSDAELAAVPLKRHEFHGDWNYTVAQSSSR